MKEKFKQAKIVCLASEESIDNSYSIPLEMALPSASEDNFASFTVDALKQQEKILQHK